VEFIKNVDVKKHPLGFGIDRERRVEEEGGIIQALKSLGISSVIL
jgi:hypothetical protein